LCHPNRTSLGDDGAAANGSNRAGWIAAESGGQPMKSIISVLFAVSILGLAAIPAGAFDQKTFWEQQERTMR
jgi:hypothetical protein